MDTHLVDIAADTNLDLAVQFAMTTPWKTSIKSVWIEETVPCLVFSEISREGWTELPFVMDVEFTTQFIKNWLEGLPPEVWRTFEDPDVLYKRGWRIRNFNFPVMDGGSTVALVFSVEPYKTEYHK